MLLPEAVNAVGLRFTVVGLFASRLPFNPIELFEEPESLLRRAANFFLALRASTKRRRE